MAEKVMVNLTSIGPNFVGNAVFEKAETIST